MIFNYFYFDIEWSILECSAHMHGLDTLVPAWVRDVCNQLLYATLLTLWFYFLIIAQIECKLIVVHYNTIMILFYNGKKKKIMVNVRISRDSPFSSLKSSLMAPIQSKGLVSIDTHMYAFFFLFLPTQLLLIRVKYMLPP